MSYYVPPLSKNYCTRVNAPVPDQSSANNLTEAVAWTLKASLMDQVTSGTFSGSVRHANSVWTCLSSSDGTSVAGSDLWGATYTASKLVTNYNGSAHSWILLRNTTVNLDLLIDLNNAIAGYLRVSCADIGSYGAGTTTSGPISSTSEFQLGVAPGVAATSLILGDKTLTTQHYCHITFDDSGYFWFLVNRLTTYVFHSSIALLQTTGADPLDTRNRFLVMGGGTISNQGAPQFTYVASQQGVTSRAYDKTLAIGGASSQSYATNFVVDPNHLDDALSGASYMYPVKVWSTTPLSYRGTFPDVYECHNIIPGMSYPDVPTQTHLTAGNYLLPFYGTPLL